MHFTELKAPSSARHLLGLSGGKDSAALAIYIKERYPKIHAKMEYFFSDTGAELKEVYEFLDKLEAFLGKEIIRLNSGKSFDDWLISVNFDITIPKIPGKPFIDLASVMGENPYIDIGIKKHRKSRSFCIL